MQKPLYEVGRAAIGLLSQMIASGGDEITEEIILPPSFIE